MKKYELLLVLPGTLDDKEAEVRSEETLKLVHECGENVVVNAMGKNRLAYPIKQIRYGYFYTVVFDAEASKVKILENKLRLSREVLRSMITYYNTDVVAGQKITYSTDSSGITTMEKEREVVQVATPVESVVEVPVSVEETKEVVPVAEVEKAPAEDTAPVVEEVKKPVAKKSRKSDKLDLEEINKKLDDIISGDVISGV